MNKSSGNFEPMPVTAVNERSTHELSVFFSAAQLRQHNISIEADSKGVAFIYTGELNHEPSLEATLDTLMIGKAEAIELMPAIRKAMMVTALKKCMS